MQTGHSNMPHLATQRLPETYRPSFNGIIATPEDVRLLLEGIHERHMHLASPHWDHPPLSFLMGQTFVWDMAWFSGNQKVSDGAFWSGVFHCHTGVNEMKIDQVLQLQATEAEHTKTYENANTEHDVVTTANTPAGGKFHFSHFAHHIDSHYKSTDDARADKPERLIRQQLLVWFKEKHYLVASYYFMSQTQVLNRPDDFKQTCFGKIENCQDVKKLVELIEAGRFPRTPWYLSKVRDWELAHVNGTVLAWNLEASADTRFALKDRRFTQDRTQLTLFGPTPNEHIYAVYFMEDVDSEHQIKDEHAWKSAKSDAVKKLYKISQYTLAGRDRLIKQKTLWRKGDRRWLIVSFYYDSELDQLPSISKIYESYEAFDDRLAPNHNRQQPIASSSSHPYGSQPHKY